MVNQTPHTGNSFEFVWIYRRGRDEIKVTIGHCLGCNMSNQKASNVKNRNYFRHE